jgi:3-phenylpropionate/trans-cinnamate dioxygenase ferredoxin subunit
VSFVPVCAVADVPLGEVRPYTVAGTPVAIVNTVEGVFAIRDECSHAEVPLSEGEVDGCTLECYMHGSRFDLRTGEPLELPAVAPVPVFPVRITGEQILVDPGQPQSIATQEFSV